MIMVPQCGSFLRIFERLPFREPQRSLRLKVVTVERFGIAIGVTNRVSTVDVHRNRYVVFHVITVVSVQIVGPM